MLFSRRLSVLLGLFYTQVHAAAYDATNPIVDVGYAQYQGALNPTTNITAFIGMRFAAPPTGKNRFLAPKPPALVTGVQVANTAAPQCYQAGGGDAANQTFPFQKRATSSEDCLFLNVFYPGALSAASKLPVIVWIHGGGYAGGSAVGVDGGALIRDAYSSGGVMVVTIQYRLGAFGFLAGEEVHKNGALNAGLLDQNYALQWVHDHIAKFGGDPTKVTIWGESAGAGSVLQHVVAHGGKTSPQLFHSAITSSTFLPSQYHYNDVVPTEVYAAVVNQTNCTAATNTFACVQAVDAAVLQAANANIAANGFEGSFVFVPVVDGSFIVERPTQTLARGTVNGVVYYGVTNANEGATFVSTKIPLTTLDVYVAKLFPAFGAQQVQEVVSAYADLGLNGTFNQAVAVMGESIFICPCYYVLKAFPSTAHKARLAVPPGHHGDDLGYYFPGTRALPSGFNNTDFTKSFQQTFLAVATTSDINATPDPANVTPQWRLYREGNTEMIFNKTVTNQTDIHPAATDAGFMSRCSMWERLGSYTGQ